MRKLPIGSPPGVPPATSASAEQKLDWCLRALEWCIRALKTIERASHDSTVDNVADAFSLSNVTELRTLDANCGTLANLAAAQAAIDATRDYLLTFVQDLKRRGPKRTGE